MDGDFFGPPKISDDNPQHDDDDVDDNERDGAAARPQHQ